MILHAAVEGLLRVKEDHLVVLLTHDGFLCALRGALLETIFVQLQRVRELLRQGQANEGRRVIERMETRERANGSASALRVGTAQRHARTAEMHPPALSQSRRPRGTTGVGTTHQRLLVGVGMEVHRDGNLKLSPAHLGHLVRRRLDHCMRERGGERTGGQGEERSSIHIARAYG